MTDHSIDSGQLVDGSQQDRRTSFQRKCKLAWDWSVIGFWVIVYGLLTFFVPLFMGLAVGLVLLGWLIYALWERFGRSLISKSPTFIQRCLQGHTWGDTWLAFWAVMICFGLAVRYIPGFDEKGNDLWPIVTWIVAMILTILFWRFARRLLVAIPLIALMVIAGAFFVSFTGFGSSAHILSTVPLGALTVAQLHSGFFAGFVIVALMVGVGLAALALLSWVFAPTPSKASS
jgi:hypothetical protein